MTVCCQGSYQYAWYPCQDSICCSHYMPSAGGNHPISYVSLQSSEADLGICRKQGVMELSTLAWILRTRKSQDLWQSKWATDRCKYEAGHLVIMINRCSKCIYRETFNCDRCLAICTRCLFRKSTTSSFPEQSYWLAFLQTSCCLGPSNAACSTDGTEMLLINLKQCIQVFKTMK